MPSAAHRAFLASLCLPGPAERVAGPGQAGTSCLSAWPGPGALLGWGLQQCGGSMAGQRRMSSMCAAPQQRKPQHTAGNAARTDLQRCRSPKPAAHGVPSPAWPCWATSLVWGQGWDLHSGDSSIAVPERTRRASASVLGDHTWGALQGFA